MITIRFTWYTALTPTISIKDLTYTEVDSWTMTQVWASDFYSYDYTWTAGETYIIEADWWVTITNDLQRYIKFASTEWNLSTEQDEKLTRIDSRVDMKLSNVWSGWGYSWWVSYSNVEQLLKKFFKDFKEEQEEQRQKELELLIQEQDLNERLTRARTEKTQLKLDKQLEQVKLQLESLKESNKLNKLTTKKWLDEILGKMKEEKTEIKEVKKELEDNRDLLEELLWDDEEDLLEKLLEDEDLLELLLNWI